MSLKGAFNADMGDEQDYGGAMPKPGEIVVTACGGRLNYSTDIPWALFQGQPVYFCLPICKTDYEDDPNTSCLASRLLDFGAR